MRRIFFIAAITVTLLIAFQSTAERPVGYNAVATSTAQLQIPLADGHLGTCTATVFNGTIPFVLTAGHCMLASEGTLSFIHFQGQIDGETPTAQVIAIKNFTSENKDISVWIAKGTSDAVLLSSHAYPIQKAKTEQYQQVSCLAFRPLMLRATTSFNKVDFLIPVLGTTGELLDMSVFNPEWKDSITLSSSVWPGASGSICYDANWRPAGMIVGEISSIFSNEIPSFLETDVAINRAFDFMANYKPGAIQSPSKNTTVSNTPHFANWNKLTPQERKLWSAAYEANESYAKQLKEFIYKAQSIVIKFKDTEKLFNDYITDILKDAGKLQDWSTLTEGWEVEQISER